MKGDTSVAIISETFEYIIKLNRFNWFHSFFTLQPWHTHELPWFKLDQLWIRLGCNWSQFYSRSPVGVSAFLDRPGFRRDPVRGVCSLERSQSGPGFSRRLKLGNHILFLLVSVAMTWQKPRRVQAAPAYVPQGKIFRLHAPRAWINASL